MSPYPWQKDLWESLYKRAQAANLPHALLFTGGQGLGKALMAEQLAHTLLCQSPTNDGSPCGSCQACGLISAETHPDLLILEPEEEGKVIPVETIRSVSAFLSLKGKYGNRQIVIIRPAEAMNIYGANGLLKTLEEPTPEALIILITNKPSLLLPTIRSRCQQVSFPLPERAVALHWLNERLDLGEKSETVVPVLLSMAGGAPLEALKLYEIGGFELRQRLVEKWLQVIEGRGDPLQCAAKWTDLDFPRAINWLFSWTTDLIRLKSGADKDVIINIDLQPQLQKLATRLDLMGLFGLLEQITEYSRWSRGQLNTQLALEDIMISWGRQCRQTDRR